MHRSVTFEKFKELIAALEKSKLKYVVIGGFAVEGRRREWTRDHQDIDIICFKKDELAVEKVVKSLHYSMIEKFFDLNMMICDDGTRLDVFLIRHDDEKAVSKGKLAAYTFPKEMALFDLQKGVIDNFIFTIPCDSFIYKLSQDSKSQSDSDFCATLVHDPKKVGRIKRILRSKL